MSAEALYEAMGLEGYEVEGTWEDDGTLYVQVVVPRESLACRKCGCQRVHVDERARREWKSAPLGVTPVVITMDSPKVKCLKCGAKTWHQPTFASGQRRVTKTFEKSLEAWLSKLTIQDAAEMFGVAWHTVSEVDLARLQQLPRPQLSQVKRLAIDENYLGQRHGFVTVVLDLETTAIVSVLKGRGKSALAPFFIQLKQSKAKIKAVATDMAGGYIAAVMEHLPKAALVFDRFHVVKLMNEKLSDLRREMYHELKDKLHRKVLKGTRWLLVMNPENLRQNEKVDERAQLKEALKLNESLSIAYYLKEDLRQFWNQKSKPAAEKFLDGWCRRADASGIRQMQVMAKTLRQHRRGLLNWYDHPISTGPLEGINNKIGALQRRAYGYRNYEHLKERLLTLHHTKYTLQG
jgi:transposase